MNLLWLVPVLLVLLGGGGFYFGGPVIRGSGIGLLRVRRRLFAMDCAKAVRAIALASGILLGSLPSIVFGAEALAFVQVKGSQVTSGNTVAAAFSSSTTAGNLIVAHAVWNNTGSVSLGDSAGNTYISAVGPTRWHSCRYSSQVFYAKNIRGGADTITATFGTTISSFGHLYVHEYSGLDQSAPLDVKAAAAGSSGSLNSGSAATANAVELLFGAGVSDGTVAPPGAGYTARATANGDLTMDRSVSTRGTYNATAGNSGGAWAMQLVAFKAATAASDTTAPTVPAGLSATTVSSSQMNLSWSASTDVDNASSQLTYRVYRNGTRIGTTTAGTTSWNDTGLAASTTYTYAVNALDAAGNASAQTVGVPATTMPPPLPVISSFEANPSSIIAGQTARLSWVVSNITSLAVDHGVGIVTGASSVTVNPEPTTVYTLIASNSFGSTTAQATVTVSPDTQAPAVPGNLAAVAVSSSQIDLAWTASVDNVGVAGYQVYRNGLPVVTTNGTSYSDIGLAVGTTYTYAVTAFDAVGNVSAPASAASATTLFPSIGNYTTTFPLGENPISEGGRWINGKTVGLDWSDVRTTPGRAFAAEPGPNGYDDSTAILTGTWGSNQTATATVFRIGGNTSFVFEEIEIRLRSTVTAHANTGYEVLFRAYAPGGYAAIVRWNGAENDFTYINQNPNGNYNGIRNGDVISASISNDLIIGYVNGVEVIRGTDSAYTTGNPGMGFWLNQGTTQQADYGFTSFTATDGSTPDTQPPTVPANLAAAAVSGSQINLDWTASADNSGVAGYQVYRNGLAVKSTTAPSCSDAGLSASTTYTYAVAAFDMAGNLSAPSTAVTATTLSRDTMPPSVPSNLQSSNVASTFATIAWSASTDNVAVAGYQVLRNGTQVGTTALTSYNDTGLTASTTYAYTVAAFDSSSNLSTQSGQLFVATTAAAPRPPSFVQVKNNQIASGTRTSVIFGAPTQAGNTIVAYVIWNNTGSVTLTDTRGNAFVSAVNPVVWGANYRAQVFYAVNIAGGADTVTATFQNAVSSFGVLYIHEYAGINPVNPVDVTVSANGASATLNSGIAVTAYPNDLIFGAGVSDAAVTATGSGFTARSTAYGNITEDRIAISAGSYSATATHNGSAWGMQLIAFRPAN